jgi:outer membrane receptor protein involved in Fe transport
MFSSKKLSLTLVAITLLILSVNLAFAGTTGKISGKLYDSDKKIPVPFAAIVLKGTNYGTQADENGKFVIMNIPPGKYDVVVHLAGYKNHRIKDVIVSSDKTTVLEIGLQEYTFTDSTQVVRGYREIVAVQDPFTREVFSAKEMDAMSVEDANDLIARSKGVIMHNNEIHARGGRENEVVFNIDGVSVNDPLQGAGSTNHGMNLTTYNMQEFQIHKSGVDPEYGGFLSAIMKGITKEGDMFKTSGRLSYWTDNFRNASLNDYSFNYDRAAMSIGGPEILLSQKILPALGLDFMENRLSYMASFDISKFDGAYSFNDHAPALHQRDFHKQNIFGLTFSDRQYNNYQIQTKFTYKPIEAMKLTLNYIGQWNNSNPFNDWSYRYTPSTAPYISQNSQLLSLTLNHQINRSTFYELILSRYKTEYKLMPDDPNDPGGGMNPDDFLLYTQWEDYHDMNGNGRYDAPEPYINIDGEEQSPYADMCNWGDLIEFAGNRLDMDQFMEYTGLSWEDAQAFVDTTFFDWDGDGYIDNADGEPFVDLNGDGRWNAGDILTYDFNGNGEFDPELVRNQDVDNPEPYVDGDRNLGEPFTDVDQNGRYDAGIDIFVRSSNPSENMDLNRNSQYDGPDAPWESGIPFEDLNGNGLYDPPNGRYDCGEPFVDLNHNGKWDATDGFYDYGHSRYANYHERSAIVNTIDFKIMKQLINEVEAKAGFQVKYNELSMADLQYPQYEYDGESDTGPFEGRGIFRDFYEQYPYQAAFFSSFKLEFGSLVAMLGARVDAFFQSANIDALKDKEFVDKETVGTRIKGGPRFGLSYPIIEVAKLYFNYGHFHQLPEMEKMYRQATQASSAFGIVGNINLDYKKTISYEFGLTYLLSDDYVLDAAGFYKDYFGLVNAQRVDYGPYSRHEYQNTDYARARGFELEVRKLYGDYVSGSLAYTYSFAYGKSSSSNSNYYDDFYNRAIPIKESPLDWDVRHQLGFYLALNIPRAARTKMFGFRIPDDWGLSVNWQYQSGKPFTPSRDYPGMRLLPGEDPLVNSMRQPSKSNVDLRFHKNFRLAGLDYTFDLWVMNLFDTENVNDVHQNTGRPDTGTNIEGQVKEGSDFANNPLLYEAGRNVRVGLTMNF